MRVADIPDVCFSSPEEIAVLVGTDGNETASSAASGDQQTLAPPPESAAGSSSSTPLPQKSCAAFNVTRVSTAPLLLKFLCVLSSTCCSYFFLMHTVQGDLQRKL